MIKKSVAFNPDDPHQMRILQWVESQSNNFSGFTKDMYFAMMQGVSRTIGALPAAAEPLLEDVENAYLDIL